ncbi:hypothetical protein EAF07_09130 [Streptococcus hillyeri]|uniref:Uncharacterized protein n=2 Tax=Streptococcus hillyeri TaxID=2282420 RepID=A0A3L9DJI1_9STRE|nr:hypothetical protein EAF07_09130 [Streptococcus hillyeri]
MLSMTCVTALGLMLPVTTVSAADPQNSSSETFTILEPSDNQLVVALPEGGYIADNDGGSDFDPEIIKVNGGTLMTYAQYKTLPKINASIGAFELFPLFRAASPSGATEKVIEYGKHYTSENFSGRGWRFSGYKFKPSSGSGTYLKWKAVNDSGMVGNYDQAFATYSGQGTHGTFVSENQSLLIDGNYKWQYFYTYNPKPGSYYIVYNKE